MSTHRVRGDLTFTVEVIATASTEQNAVMAALAGVTRVVTTALDDAYLVSDFRWQEVTVTPEDADIVTVRDEDGNPIWQGIAPPN